MKIPKLWRHLERHPLSAEYRDISGPAWMRFCAKMKKVGFIATFPVIMHDGKIIDGWQRLRACIETNIEPVFKGLPDGADPQEYVEAVNDERRHETAEERDARIEVRRKRVAEARAKGESLRTIAEAEGVSHTTVASDLEEASVVNPFTTDHGKTVVPEAEKPKKVAGVDGKTYAASKPKTAPPPTEPPDFEEEPNVARDLEEASVVNPVTIDHGKTVVPEAEKPKKPKPGQPKWDDKDFEKVYGPLVRFVDERARATGKGPIVDCKADRRGDAHSVLQHLLGEMLRVFKTWKGET